MDEVRSGRKKEEKRETADLIKYEGAKKVLLAKYNNNNNNMIHFLASQASSRQKKDVETKPWHHFVALKIQIHLLKSIFLKDTKPLYLDTQFFFKLMSIDLHVTTTAD